MTQKVSIKVLMRNLFMLAIVIFILAPGSFAKAESESQYKGIDISNWDGNVDMSKVKDAGYSFVISKLTEGTTYVDKYGKQNIENTKNNGLIAGAYHFARFKNKADAIKEAEFFKENCPSNVDFIALDFEQDCTGDMTEACLTFLDSVSSIAPAVIYTNPSHINEHLNSDITKYPLWVANYGVSTPSVPKWDTYAIWQYSDNGQVAGIDGAVDLDISGPAFDTIIKVKPQPNSGSNGDGDAENNNALINLEMNDGATYSDDVLDVKGWALKTSGEALVELYVDGQYVKTMDCNLSTPDVASKYSGYPNAENSGYDDKVFLENGYHTIKVYTTDDAGNEVYKEININVEENTKTIAEKTNIDPNKVWTIDFNSKLDKSTVNSDNIEVYDSEGNKVNADVSYKDASNEVIINPPSTGYEAGKSYTIRIANGVKNVDNKELSATTIMKFAVKA